MHTENLFIDQRRKAEIIKYLSAVTPHINRPIFSQTFIIKSIHLCDLSAFVVSTDQCDAVWVSYLIKYLINPIIIILSVYYLESEQEEKRFYTIESSIHKITHKKVIGFWTLSTHFEQFLKIIKLAMNVSTDLRNYD